MRSVLHKAGGLSQSCVRRCRPPASAEFARQHLDAEAFTADRLGHREYEPDKQKPDESANPERARRSVLGPRCTRPEPRLRKSIGGLTKDRVTGLDNLASTIQDLVKRTRVGSRIAILARSEHGTSKPDRREWGIFLGTRSPVFQKGEIHCKKLTHQRLANRCASGENGVATSRAERAGAQPRQNAFTSRRINPKFCLNWPSTCVSWVTSIRPCVFGEKFIM